MSKNRILAFLNVLGLAATIVVSYVHQVMIYPTPVTPAPYAFSIWGLIYFSLIGFVVYDARVGTRVGGWFLVTCAANCGWVFAWLNAWTGISLMLMVILLGALLRIIVLTDMELTDPLWPEIVFVWWPFSFYTGWITVAILANIAAWLVKLGIGVSSGGAVALLLLAGVVYFFMTWKRNMREYALVGVWGLVAIAQAHWHRMPAVAGVAVGLSVVLFVSSGLHAWRNRAYGPFRKRN